MQNPKHIFISTVISLLLTAGLVESTLAHVDVAPDSAPANAKLSLKIGIPHGCGDSATTRVRVQVPDGVEFISAPEKQGWELAVKNASNVAEVAWTGGPLPGHEKADFEIHVKLPNRPGEKLYFKTIQECEEGVARWIEIPKDGEDIANYEKPAPVLTLTAPE